jgi:hypothetical protein
MEATQEVINEMLARPSDFADFSGDPDLFVTWGFSGISVHRDSDVLDQSNWETITNDLQERFPDDCYIYSANHWAVGWLDHLAIRVVDKYGEPTKVLDAVVDWANALEDYPVADEDDYSRREHDDFLETIENCYYPSSFVDVDSNIYYEPVDEYPEDWVDQMARVFFDEYSICRSEELGCRMAEEVWIKLNLVEAV